MLIATNNHAHLGEFVRLNELWITEHFCLEDADKALAADPAKVITNGGYIFSASVDDEVVGVCALFKDSEQRYQLARMAVAPNQRGKGYGKALMQYAIAHAKSVGASTIYLLSNTALSTAISLYKQSGFNTLSEGKHPVYARCNIVMELPL